jgi:hypothetical protein
MVDWKALRVQEMHCDALRRQVNWDLLAEEVTRLRGGLARQALAALGRRLVAWGEQLVKRYGNGSQVYRGPVRPLDGLAGL